jgi:hypothetical protein
MMLDALTSGRTPGYIDSLGKARIYKLQADGGTLKYQKLSDARAEPPRGFLPVPALIVPGKFVLQVWVRRIRHTPDNYPVKRQVRSYFASVSGQGKSEVPLSE